jgi:transcriptional regulator with XRE-family HTH domain
MNFSEGSQMSTNLNSKKSLIRRLQKGREARNRFVESHLDKKLAFQIRSLRGDSSQEEMEKRTGIKQQAISRLENPYYGKATLTTLKKIATACDVALLVEFVPFSQLINRASGTPYIERGFSPATMNVPSFDEEARHGAFVQLVEPRTAILGRPQTLSTPQPEELNRIHLLKGGKSAEVEFDYEQPSEQKTETPNFPFPPQGHSDQIRLRVAGGPQ